MKQKHSPVAIVTGATAGIGLATSNLLKKEGYTVYGTSRRPASDSQNGVAMLACDVTSDESVALVIAEVLRRSGRIDLLVNNAGFGLIAGAEESSIEQAKSIFEVNVFGVMRMTNHVLPVMRQKRNGRVINISSVVGFVPAPYYAIYGATKHAIDGYPRRSIMKCAGSAFESSQSSQPSHELRSRQIWWLRIGLLRSTTRYANPSSRHRGSRWKRATSRR